MPASKHQSRAAVNGATLEADIAAALTRAGPACYWHQNYPRSLGQRVVGKGPPDFVAAWPTLALTVLFDAKSTIGERWSVGSDDPNGTGKYRGLAPHQRTALRRMADAGGTAGVWLRLRSSRDPMDLWIPFQVVDPLWTAWWSDPARKERYVTPEMGTPIVNGDLLAALRVAR